MEANELMKNKPLGLLPEYAHLGEDAIHLNERMIIQGSNVAGTEFAAALRRHGSIPVERFVSLSLLKTARSQLVRDDTLRVTHQASSSSSTWVVHPHDALPGRLESNALLALHTIEGPLLTTALASRSRHSERPIPITGVTHGLAHEDRLNADWMATLLSETLPCDAIVCVSPSARTALQRIFESFAERLSRFSSKPIRPALQLPVIPWGTDLDRFHPGDAVEAREELGLSKDEILLLSLGRLDPSAKMDLLPLLLALKRISRTSSRAYRLLVAGADKLGYGARIVERAHELGLGDRVILLGDIPPAAQPALYRACDVFITLSDTLTESFGLTLCEAGASGLPVVASDWDGYRDILREGETGFLIPTRSMPAELADDPLSSLGVWSDALLRHAQSIQVDVPALAERIARLTGDAALRREMGERARRRMEALYAWPEIIRQYEALWDDLSERASSLEMRREPSPFSALPPLSELFPPSWKGIPEEVRIALTPSGEALAAGDARLLSWLPEFSLLSGDSMRETVARIAESGSMSWREARGDGEESETGRVLWLLRHGYAEERP